MENVKKKRFSGTFSVLQRVGRAFMLPIALSSIIVYLIKVQLNWEIFGIVGAGFVVGGAVGALLLKRLNGKIVRLIFIFIVLAAGIRLLI